MRRIVIVALVLLGAAVAPHSTSAQMPNAGSPLTAPQPAEAPQFISITDVIVKPEMMAEFQNFVKNETNPGLRKGGTKWRNVWQQTAVAGNAFEFIIAGPIDNFAQYDSPGPLEKGLGKDGFTAWQAKAGRLVTSVRRFVIRTRPDLSYQTTMAGPPKLAVSVNTIVAQGHAQDYENFIKNEYLPVIRQGHDIAYLVAQTIFGGDVNEYVSLTLRSNFADIDKGPTTVQVLGADASMKLMQKIPAGTIVHSERTLMRFVPELSIMPTGMANK